jgi:hypothetical protein
MSKILRNDNTFTFSNFDAILEKLPVGNYLLNYNDMSGYFLTLSKSFKVPEKLYGNPRKFTNRVLKTYNHLTKNMGVLLSGEKGSGKSVDMKIIACDSNLPVICVSSAYSGTAFIDFLGKLNFKCVFLFDEFEKTYSDDSQKDSLLTVLDGILEANHLFILTSNSSNIGCYFDNRPSRIRYHRKYGNLDKAVVNEIISDRLIHTKRTEKVVEFVERLGKITIDGLVSLIDEVNIHDEDPDEFEELFNFTRDYGVKYDVTIIRKQWLLPKVGVKYNDFKDKNKMLKTLQENVEDNEICKEDEDKYERTDLNKTIRKCIFFHGDGISCRFPYYTSINIDVNYEEDAVLSVDHKGSDMLIKMKDGTFFILKNHLSNNILAKLFGEEENNFSY